MNRYLVRIKAIPAWRGNPEDPIFWDYTVQAKTPEGAKAICRSYRNVPNGAPMETFSLPRHDGRWPFINANA